MRADMGLLFRILAIAVVASVGLALTAAGLAYYLAARSLPDYDAGARIEGLEGPVEIVRDAHAIPHIFAQTDADAFLALGWVHAQDRLWQMEIQRRTAQGRLAELFGPEALPIDRSMRALDLDGLAAAALDAQTAKARAALEAYAAGVNARIRAVGEEALGRGAPEFFLFGGNGLAPWTPEDSLAIVKLMALRLSDAARLEARRARLLARLSPEQVDDLHPPYPEPGLSALPAFSGEAPPPGDRAEAAPVAPPPRAASAGPAPRRGRSALAALSPFPEPGFGGASNAWAVSGERAAAASSTPATVVPHSAVPSAPWV